MTGPEPHTDASWIVELLGPEASDVGFEARPDPGSADDTAAYLIFRGATIAATGEGRAGAAARLREKVEAHLEALRALPEIPAVQELNLVRRTLGGESRRVRVRPMDAQRALLEYDLGLDPSVLFHDVATRTYSLVWREPSGEPVMIGIGQPVHGDDGGSASLPIPGRTPPPAEVLRLRDEKAQRVRALLRCPRCRGELSDGEGRLRCAPCNRDFPYRDGAPVLAEDPGYTGSAEGIAVSQNTYGDQVLELIERNRDGWVLDMGSGSPTTGFYNVVHLDLFAFPAVDVVTDGGALPFADDTFDAILSEAVLEHVTDPIAYTRELARVLKPGGRVRLDAAFLQPFHAYPDHFFNMTSSGLRLVVESVGLEVLDLGVGQHQSPFVAAALLLGGLVQGTPDPALREELLGTSVGELLERIQAGGGPLFEGLTAEATERLAAGFGCLARKPLPEAR
jgi:SAM-dependent methyltransferase